MPHIDNPPSGLAALLREQEGVMSTASALGWMSRQELRWRVTSGRWQRPCYGIVLTHSGPMTLRQRLWVALLWAGQGAALAGLTAADLDGLEGFASRDGTDRPVQLLVPSYRSMRRKPPGLPVVVHYSTMLAPGDIHPLREPRRTRLARSLVDAAAWMATDRGAQAVLAAGVQQRLARLDDLTAIVARNQRLPRRAMITDTLEDIAGGAHALSELDFTRLIGRYRLPCRTGRRRGGIQRAAAGGWTRCGRPPGLSSRWTAAITWMRASTGPIWTATTISPSAATASCASPRSSCGITPAT